MNAQCEIKTLTISEAITRFVVIPARKGAFDDLVFKRVNIRCPGLIKKVKDNFTYSLQRERRPGESQEQWENNVRIVRDELNYSILTRLNMETTVEELRIANEEIEQSKKNMQGLFNELLSVRDNVEPLIKKQIEDIRHIRMTTVSEVGMALNALRDIRKFFLESDYEKEIKRLYDFVALCKELKKLKDDGTLDALCETAIKLAIKE